MSRSDKRPEGMSRSDRDLRVCPVTYCDLHSYRDLRVCSHTIDSVGLAQGLWDFGLV